MPPQLRASLCFARSWNTCVLESRRQLEWLRTALRNPHSRSRADAPTAHSAPPARPEPPHRPVALWLTHCRPPGLRPSPLALLPASRETPCALRAIRGASALHRALKPVPCKAYRAPIGTDAPAGGPGCPLGGWTRWRAAWPLARGGCKPERAIHGARLTAVAFARGRLIRSC